VLWEAFFQRKQCYSPKIKHFCPPHKFLGWLRHWVRRIFARITQTCPKSFSATFAFRFLSKRSWKTFLWYDLQRRSSCAFLQTLGTNFSNQTTLGAIFSWICRDFAQIFKDFTEFSTNRNFWRCACTSPPTALHLFMATHCFGRILILASLKISMLVFRTRWTCLIKSS